MKKSLKRVFSVLLAAAMLLGMSVTSFAAENSDGGESQAILRGPAAPITSVTLRSGWTFNKSERCFDFAIEQHGIGPGTVTFDNTTLMPYRRDPLYGSKPNEVTGWIIYYKSPKLYSPGTYRMEGVFISNNGTQKRWTVSHDFVLKESDLS